MMRTAAACAVTVGLATTAVYLLNSSRRRRARKPRRRIFIMRHGNKDSNNLQRDNFQLRLLPEAFEQGGDVVGLSCLMGFMAAIAVKSIGMMVQDAAVAGTSSSLNASHAVR